MPQFSSSKSETSALAQTHARLKAWWNGDPAPKFESVKNEEGADSANLSSAAGTVGGDAPAPAAVDAEVAHVQACVAMWGNGWTYPTHQEFENQLIGEAGGAKSSRFALFGGGVGGTAQLIVQTTSSKVEIFEANPNLLKIAEKTLKAHKQAKRFGVHAFDWQPGSVPKSKADAALFIFQGGVEGRIEEAAFCAERLLRPGANAIWLDFFARTDNEALDACRGIEQRIFASEDEAIIAFSASGLDVRADDDWSVRYLNAFDRAWQELHQQLGVRQAALIKQGGLSAGSAALADLMVWKARAEAIRSGKLTVRRITATK